MSIPKAFDNSTYPSLFKFMSGQYAEALLAKGVIRLGTLFDFRRVENHGHMIGDDAEGKFSTLIESSQGFDLSPEFQNTFLDITGSTNVTISNSTFTTVDPNCHVYCLSMTDDCLSSGTEEYDVTLQLVDPSTFLAHMTYLITERFGAQPSIQYGKCIYLPQPLDHRYFQKYPPSFVKSMPYVKQQEFRFCFHTKQSGELNPEIFEWEPLGKSFSVVEPQLTR